MNAAARLLAFAALLGALLAGGALAGAAVGPAPRDAAGPSPAHGGHASGAARPDAVRGLAVAEHGLRLEVVGADLSRGRREELRLRIRDEQGRVVRDFDVAHERRMHLIIARRDLGDFQHLHPELLPDGTWRVPVRLRRAGSYRVFADFSHAGTPTTLASDLRVDGNADLRPLAGPRHIATTGGGYDVRLATGAVHPGAEAQLRFTVSRDGRPVDTDPYLGAGGHLVALREGDLAFLHVHPQEHGSAIAFAATFPSAGRYGLFLQFKHAGRVRTAAFTQEVREP